MAKGKKSNGNDARPERHLGIEAQLSAAADKMRGHMDASESVVKSRDVLGRVYEHFLGKFASSFGYLCREPSEASATTRTLARRGSASDSASQFYTPQCVVHVLVAMLEPCKGRVF